MQPVGRTVSFDRGWIVSDLEDVKREREQELEVEIARASNFFPAGWDFHRSWSKNASLVG